MTRAFFFFSLVILFTDKMLHFIGEASCYSTLPVLCHLAQNTSHTDTLRTYGAIKRIYSVL